jgi:anti-sigma factor (TIGR02949 family)
LSRGERRILPQRLTTFTDDAGGLEHDMRDATATATKPGPMDCDEAMAVLWQFLDRDLSPDLEAALRAHLEACRPCLCHHDFDRAFLAAVAAARATDPAPPELRRRVTSMLQAQGLLS